MKLLSYFTTKSREVFVFHKIKFKNTRGHNLLTDKREISAYLNISVSKAIPLQARTSPEGSRSFRLVKFLENRHTKVVRLSALCTGRLYPPEVIPGTHFCWRLSRPLGNCGAERDSLMKNSDDLIGNQTRYIPVRSAGLYQPHHRTTLS
jgi:hypothetical protein